MTEIPLTVKIRAHHLPDIQSQVKNGQPDSLPAYIPKGIRDSNEELVNLILLGAAIEVVRDQPDLICLACSLLATCNFKDPES
ncbi:hypothetical protein A2363_00800 [Candidatus Gottesmanbacteria bacterium RIFOXYB1_FULL_47_11]|uniref:Uncharacterized protein n=1 Tax=Candidatus Gottesmanbacteria bacterium RIFOXYB1_FULL_47_11 TaxID=1798401 RepID=A0A1F6BGK6_9BACT|nr:MAG: hypothetical protein A2363_00800 [Candidatus Gottesmanbacteria bacterium RIFOXYB1_FULL_47_11]